MIRRFPWLYRAQLAPARQRTLLFFRRKAVGPISQRSPAQSPYYVPRLVATLISLDAPVRNAVGPWKLISLLPNDHRFTALKSPARTRRLKQLRRPSSESPPFNAFETAWDNLAHLHCRMDCSLETIIAWHPSWQPSILSASSPMGDVPHPSPFARHQHRTQQAQRVYATAAGNSAASFTRSPGRYPENQVRPSMPASISIK